MRIVVEVSSRSARLWMVAWKLCDRTTRQQMKKACYPYFFNTYCRYVVAGSHIVGASELMEQVLLKPDIAGPKFRVSQPKSAAVIPLITLMVQFSFMHLQKRTYGDVSPTGGGSVVKSAAVEPEGTEVYFDYRRINQTRGVQ
ncbi:hypothetical protein EVAR_9591_1 [Eumeta japonica]|uniref:Uncharacterized protein n=1 Tax=Eumeta variegata TaxID=151549 RepID=A0A4C1TJJ1_EUMVA|nr:hypothetical protein EVAR_9591_1 [Eumeta japonica]